jgi:L-rhamnose-H+ transport protein
MGTSSGDNSADQGAASVSTAQPAVVEGIFLAVLSGLMNGTFTLPMRFLGRWSWENVWALFVVVSCVAMPIVVALTTVTNFRESLATAPRQAIVFAVVTGFAWGFGTIMFGQGISAVGISLGNTLVLAISSSLGSFLPIFVLAPDRLFHPQGKAVILGAIVAMVGIAACGYSGWLRERSQKGEGASIRGDMVGETRPFRLGLLLCTGAGLLSAVFNIGYSSAQGLAANAVRWGNSPFAASNLVWLLMLTSGSVVNLAFCRYLFQKNGTWSKYARQDGKVLYLLTILMGLLWGGSVFVYGSAAPKLGKLGPAIGWPLSLTVGLVTANVCGLLAGEWKLSGVADRAWMIAGLIVLLGAILILGWSGTLP